MNNTQEHAQALRVAAAFAEAHQLIERLGQDHPRALMAIIKAVNLADPGFMEKTARECGVTLPEASHVSDSGELLFSSEVLAQALQQPHDAVLRQIDDMAAAGIEISKTAAHRIQ